MHATDDENKFQFSSFMSLVQDTDNENNECSFVPKKPAGAVDS